MYKVEINNRFFTLTLEEVMNYLDKVNKGIAGPLTILAVV